MIRPKISPGDNDAEKKGGDQLDLVTEEVNVEDQAGEDGVVAGLSEDGDEDQGGHDAAGQVATRDHEEENVGDVASLFASFFPVEENHDGCQAAKEAEDDTEWCDQVGQERDRQWFEHCGVPLLCCSVNCSQIESDF